PNEQASMLRSERFASCRTAAGTSAHCEAVMKAPQRAVILCERSPCLLISRLVCHARQASGAGGIQALVWPFRGWVDHLADLGNLRCRETADLGVLANDVLIFGKIHTECFVVGDVGFKPLDVGAKLAQYSVRFCCGSAKLLPLEGANLGDI